MKLTMAPGTTSKIVHLFIQDSSSTTGAGLTGVAFGDITAYYMREGAATPVSITLATIATLGTWETGGFKEVDATNLPGVYEFHPPNAMLAAGAAQVVAMLKGATDMAPLPLEIQIDSPMPEHTGVPSATPTQAQAAMWAYMKSRNLETTTATASTVANDAGATISTSTISDNGTTFTKGEYA